MLHKKIKIFFSLFILALGIVNAQQNKKLKGLIVIDFKDENPEGVIVTNRQTHNSVKSDITGSFQIHASVGDTLYFQGDFLMDRKLAIKKVHFTLDPLIVHMNQEVIELEEVVVRPPLTGDMAKDMKSVERKENIEKVYANLGIDIRTLDMKPEEKIVKAYDLASPLAFNIDALYKGITGYYVKMRNLRQYVKLDDKFIAVQEYFGDEYFTEIIGIKKGDIREFLLYLRGVDSDFYDLYYSQKDYLSLDRIMRENAPNFKKRLKERDSQPNQSSN